MLALMRRVVSYHSSWVGKRQVELFDASGIRVWCKDERVIPVCLYTHQWPPFIADPVELCLRSLAPFLRLKPSAVVQFMGWETAERPPRSRGRGRGKFQDESGGQNKDQHSFPSRGRGRGVEDEVDDLTTRVESMEIVIARFQRMSPQIFNGDESREDADSWIRHITGFFDRVQYDDMLRLSLATFQLRKSAERWCTCVTLNGSGIQLAVGSQPLRHRNHNFGLTHRIMVNRKETSPLDPLGINDSACKNQLVMAPESDQIHRESGTSKTALEELTNLSRTEPPRRRDRNKSNHEENGLRPAASGGREVEVEKGGSY
ncbi:hypothetical protein F511_31852 [Dorcoceras hygrometricum]|uniref:Uncharacterized protein n=1 Tax=Dorcoceras hygrometricum TaxID=472368 RepID=A0A2Z7DCP6_9LAMI|nr:hypothetical protein F511_31852 [Dorcoceras hygrometricum]